MPFKLHEITVDIKKQMPMQVQSKLVEDVCFEQNDFNTAKLIINITEDGEPLDLTAATAIKIGFLKEDKTVVEQDNCQPINKMIGRYYVVLNAEVLSYPGRVVGQVEVLFPDNQKLTSTRFPFSVNRSILSDDALKSTNKLPMIEKAIEAGEILKDKDVAGLVTAAETATEAANAATAEVQAAREGFASVDARLDDLKSKADTNSQQIGILEQSVTALQVGGMGGSGGGLVLREAVAGETFTIQSTTTPTSPTTVTVAGVTLDQVTVFIQAGSTKQLAATIAPTTATNKSVTWSSSNTSVATVNSSGLVTAVATGSATITVATVDGGFTASCALTVTASAPAPTPTTAAIYEDNGYLNMPVTAYSWWAITGYTPAGFIGIASTVPLSSLYDKTVDENPPVVLDGMPYAAFIANMPNTIQECSTVATYGSPINKVIAMVSTAHGATSADILTYWNNSGKRMKLKLASGYKKYRVSSNINTVTTRTSGVNASFEYFKCVLADGIGSYVPPTTADVFQASNGYEIAVVGDYVYSNTSPIMRINADSTLEMLLPKGTLSSIDAAGVSAYLASQNIDIFYV